MNHNHHKKHKVVRHTWTDGVLYEVVNEFETLEHALAWLVEAEIKIFKLYDCDDCLIRTSDPDCGDYA